MTWEALPNYLQPVAGIGTRSSVVTGQVFLLTSWQHWNVCLNAPTIPTPSRGKSWQNEPGLVRLVYRQVTIIAQLSLLETCK